MLWRDRIEGLVTHATGDNVRRREAAWRELRKLAAVADEAEAKLMLDYEVRRRTLKEVRPAFVKN